jgi:hypothetical protein
MSREIAAALGCARNWVTKLLKHWFQARGLTMPDGRARRATLGRKQLSPTMYQQLADEAKALWDSGLADVQIALRLNCSPPTAVAAVAYWHTSRALTAPGHGARRAALVDQMEMLYRQGLMIKQIAAKVAMCTRSVTLLLKERFAGRGEPMPDGRKRRFASRQEPLDNPTFDAVDKAPPQPPTS